MKPHGTLNRYNAKCRCADCRAANTAYHRDRRERTAGVEVSNESKTWLPVNGCLPVFCWCETEIVHVTVEDIRVGLTGTCGLPGCRQSVMV